MYIIGELINSTRRAVAQAINLKDKEYLQELARQQAKAGAHAIDLNAAACGNEIENLKWLVEIVQEVVDTPLCIDSPDPEAIAAGLELCQRTAVINSITAEKDRWEQILPIVQKHKARVIALCMDDSGMPESVEDRLRIADKLVRGLTKAGVAQEDIFLDPLIKPLSVNDQNGQEAFQSTNRLHQEFPQVHIVSGLSNISFGLPERKLLNRAFLVMSIAMGMDAFILDPLDGPIMSMLAASTALTGKDEYCMNYITGFRKNRVKA